MPYPTTSDGSLSYLGNPLILSEHGESKFYIGLANSRGDFERTVAAFRQSFVFVDLPLRAFGAAIGQAKAAGIGRDVAAGGVRGERE